MKITHGGSNVIASHGVTNEANFQIKANAHAFRILSSGLYSDKVSAVLREIGCNAVDSHVAAGKPEPIEVKLPTKLDTSFYIKDYGVGLTHEEVTGLFTTYFSSNKGESNEVTGAFGLGSKSPFSYTDSFMITAVKDGVKRFYTAHIGQDGSPVISQLGDGQPADEDWPSGMMVSFPVKPEDIEEFHNKAQSVFRWFRIKPNIIGGEAIKEPKFEIVGSNFRIASRDPDVGSKARVIMGNVAYPLVKERLETKDPLILSLIDAGVHVEVPIGAVMPTASREDLEYDPTTRQNLIEALTAVAKEIAETIRKKAKSGGATEWERRKNLRKFASVLPHSVTLFIDRYLAQLDDLTKAQQLELAAQFRQDRVSLPSWVGRRVGDVANGTEAPIESNFRVHLYRAGERENTLWRREVLGGRVARGSTTDSADLLFDEEVAVVIGDAPHTHERLKAYVLESKQKVALISVTGATKEEWPALEAYARRIAQAMGGIPVKKSSEYELPQEVRLKKAKAKGENVKPERLHAKEMVTYWNTNTHVSELKTVKLSEIPEEGKYFLPMVRRSRPFEYKTSQRHYIFSNRDMNRLMNAYRKLRSLGLPLPKIEGVVVGSAAKIRGLGLEEGGWKNFFDAILEAFNSEEVLKAMKEQVSLMPAVDAAHYYGAYRNTLFVRLMREAQRDTKVWQALAPVLKDHARLRALIREGVAASMPKNRKAEMRKAIDEIVQHWSALAEPIGKLGLIYPNQFKALIKDLYPLTAFVDGDTFSMAAEESPEAAAQFMRAVLKVKSEAAQSEESATVTDIRGVQLPLAFAG